MNAVVDDADRISPQFPSRILDMSHGLIQQTKEKRRRVFGIVKERILTTQPCSVIEEVQQGVQFAGGLSLCGPRCTKVEYQIERISRSGAASISLCKQRGHFSFDRFP